MSSIADSSGGRAHGLSVQNRTDLPDTLETPVRRVARGRALGLPVSDRGRSEGHLAAARRPGRRFGASSCAWLCPLGPLARTAVVCRKYFVFSSLHTGKVLVLPFAGGVSPLRFPVFSFLFSASYPQARRSYYLFFNYLFFNYLYMCRFSAKELDSMCRFSAKGRAFNV